MQRAWVRSLVRELRSHKVHSAAKKTKNSKADFIQRTVVIGVGTTTRERDQTQL